LKSLSPLFAPKTHDSQSYQTQPDNIPLVLPSSLTDEDGYFVEILLLVSCCSKQQQKMVPFGIN